MDSSALSQVVLHHIMLSVLSIRFSAHNAEYDEQLSSKAIQELVYYNNKIIHAQQVSRP